MTQDERPTSAEEKEPIKVAISLPQIVGGALAAATAAAIGSQLGVAGTIFGAAVASIVGGIGGTLYSAGIDRTHRKVTSAISRGYERLRNSDDYDPDAVRGLGEEPELPLPGLEQPAPGDGPERSAEPDAPGARRRRLWKAMGLTAAAMFVLALVAITVVELGLGRALDGRNGTTVSQVVRRDPKPSATPTPTPTPTRTPTPSATVPTTPAPTPSATLPPETPEPTAPDPTGTPEPTAPTPAPTPS